MNKDFPQSGQIIGVMTNENTKNHFNDYGNCIIRLWLGNWEYRNDHALYVAINRANVYRNRANLQHTDVNIRGGRVEKVLIIFAMVIGVFMVSLTINSLGDTGNRIMNFGGGLLMFSASMTAFQMNRKR